MKILIFYLGSSCLIVFLAIDMFAIQFGYSAWTSSPGYLLLAVQIAVGLGRSYRHGLRGNNAPRQPNNKRVFVGLETITERQN